MARPLPDSDPTAEARNLKDLLPPGVHVVFSEARHATAELHPLEQEFLNARAMQPLREREFRVGRALAREALAQVGVSGHPLLPAETREPLWPHGVIGSISHCEGVCAVAVAESMQFSGLGIDLELVDRIDERIASTVCTPDEQNALEAMASPVRRRHLALLFSGKESVFKALFPLTREFLEFHDVALAIADNAFTARATKPGVHKVESLNGRFLAGSRLIATAAWLPKA
jgi:enterobactin synthetase component D / holo-[acyl-carrier protein] synthase